MLFKIKVNQYKSSFFILIFLGVGDKSKYWNISEWYALKHLWLMPLSTIWFAIILIHHIIFHSLCHPGKRRNKDWVTETTVMSCENPMCNILPLTINSPEKLLWKFSLASSYPPVWIYSVFCSIVTLIQVIFEQGNEKYINCFFHLHICRSTIIYFILLISRYFRIYLV